MAAGTLQTSKIDVNPAVFPAAPQINLLMRKKLPAQKTGGRYECNR